MAVAASDFGTWLIDKLKALKIDEGVYGSYITGILEGDESVDDKKEALEGILSEIVDKDVEAVVTELLEKWESCQPKEDFNKSTVDVVDAQLAKLMNTRCLATTARREYTDEEKKIREAILSQYSQLSDNEDEAVSVEVPESSDLRETKTAKRRQEREAQDSERREEEVA
ncbi:NBP2b protein, partial [Operophtera brumata]